MSTSSFSSSRSRRIATAASALTVIALPSLLLALVIGAGVPESWWPRTGEAFAVESPSGSARQDACESNSGPAKEHCERGHRSPTSTASTDEAHPDGARAARMLVPPAAVLTAVVVWPRRGAAGHGRR